MDAGPLHLHGLITDYPNTRALRDGRVASPLLRFDLEEVTRVYDEFGPFLRGEKYDVAELATVTFLQAREAGLPLVLLPFVMNARLQHDCLVHDVTHPFAPEDLAGRRIGVRSYSQTTVTWVRGLLETEYGIAPESITWVTQDGAHVAGHDDPPWCERADKGARLPDMLLSGRIDAAVIAPRFVTDARIAPLIPDVARTALAWHRRTGICPMNHMAVVRESLCRDRPDLVAEIFRLLVASKRAAGTAPDLTPAGYAALRPSLEALITHAHRSGAIRRRFSAEELFDDVTRDLAA